MNDIGNMNTRRNYLAMKKRLGLPLTEAEQRELDYILSLRVTRTTMGTILIEDANAPKTLEEWEAMIPRINAAAEAARGEPLSDK